MAVRTVLNMSLLLDITSLPRKLFLHKVTQNFQVFVFFFYYINQKKTPKNVKINWLLFLEKYVILHAQRVKIMNA